MSYGENEHPHAECRERIAALEAEVERMTAIVDKLPVDADGDPLVPNTTYWCTSHSELWSGIYTIAATRLQPSYCPLVSCFAPNVPGVYHKTREAAEAAGGERC